MVEIRMHSYSCLGHTVNQGALSDVYTAQVVSVATAYDSK